MLFNTTSQNRNTVISVGLALVLGVSTRLYLERMMDSFHILSYRISWPEPHYAIFKSSISKVGSWLYQNCSQQGNFRSKAKFSRRYSDNLSINEATVVSAIEPGKKGRIRLHGVFWFAKASSDGYGTISEGSIVIEIGRVGNTLIVRPVSDHKHLV